MARVIKVDNMYLISGDEHISGMKIGVDTDVACMARAVVAVLNTRKYKLADAFVRRLQFVRDEIIIQQEFG